MSDKHYEVAVIGAGYIADVHLQVLRSLSNVNVAAVCDVSQEKAARLAKKYGVDRFYTDTETIISNRLADSVHILVPPPLHACVARPFLEAGIDVFLEKPMAETEDQCNILENTARKGGARLCINHNYAFNPALLRAKEIIDSGELGKVRHIQYRWNVPLRQLNSKQFGHWMFRRPVNILLEQAVHPLSQIYALAGDIHSAEAVTGKPIMLSPGKPFFDTWHFSLMCERATAQLLFSVGQNYNSFGMLVLCDDGQIILDYKNNLCTVQKTTKWPDFFDSFQSSVSMSEQILKNSISNVFEFVLSTAGVKTRSDFFYISMFNSIKSFYESSKQNNLINSASVGRSLVGVCELVGEKVCATVKKEIAPVINPYDSDARYDAVLIGGTGFIGKKVVEKMIDKGKRVLVVARNICNLSSIFLHQRVSLVAADITDALKMNEIIKGIPHVVHLAHGGSFDTLDAAETSMVAGTRNIAEACLEHKVLSLIYIGTIASLYLGNPKDKITGNTPLDPQIRNRPVYSHAKARCENILSRMHQQRGLPVTVLRPGLVIGEDGLPFHSGLGVFNQDCYCIGWNNGENPLPFVLVEDVAEAIIKCMDCTEKVIGKSFNIVGDVRLTGKEYIEELGRQIGRKLHYLPQSQVKIQSIEVFKWLVKVICQKRKVAFPSYRDLKSRGLKAQFDCTDFKQLTGWKPEHVSSEFIKKGIAVYAR